MVYNDSASKKNHALTPLITTEDVAEWLRVDVVTVRRLVAKGQLTAYRVGSEYRFKQEDLDDYLTRQRVTPKGKSPGWRALPELLHKSTGSNRDHDPFQNFTRRAIVVVELAGDEAKRFNHAYIGTEHLLLGLLREGKGVGAKVLADLSIDLREVRSAVESVVGTGSSVVEGDIALTPRTKKVLELATIEARRLGHHYVGTEHLLLGLVREGDGVAGRILQSLGVDMSRVVTETERIIAMGTP